jgi:hypothetical protein
MSNGSGDEWVDRYIDFADEYYEIEVRVRKTSS